MKAKVERYLASNRQSELKSVVCDVPNGEDTTHRSHLANRLAVALL